MKRVEIIKKLISEGFSDKFLSKLTDSQLKNLTERVLSEATYEVPAEKIDQLKDKVNDEDIIKVSEEDEMEEASSPAQQAAIAIAMKKSGKKPKKDMDEWVESVVNENYHSHVTTKKEIYEIIGSISDGLGDAKNMFDVDEQQPSPSRPDTDAPVREKPTTRPGKPSRENPFQPKHTPKPKAKLPKELTFSALGLNLKQAAE